VTVTRQTDIVERCGTCCRWHPEIACCGLCIPSFIGWTFLNESSTSSVCLCTDAIASTTKLLGTWWLTAHQIWRCLSSTATFCQ